MWVNLELTYFGGWFCNVRSWFWRRCWLGCGRDEPLWRNSGFSPFNLICGEKASRPGFLPQEACKSKPLNQQQPGNALCPLRVRLVGTLLPLPVVNPSGFPDLSVPQALFLMLKQTNKQTNPPQNGGAYRAVQTASLRGLLCELRRFRKDLSWRVNSPYQNIVKILKTSELS